MRSLVRMKATLCGWLLTCLLFVVASCAVSSQAFANIGNYKPIFKETGLHRSGDYHQVESEVSVDYYTGSVHTYSSDLMLASLGTHGMALTRFYSNRSRETEGPLGLGWSMHLGYLRRSPKSGGKLEFYGGNGAREVFHLHNHEDVEDLNPWGDPPDEWAWISESLKTVHLEDQKFTLYDPSGVVYHFELAGKNTWVPVRIRDFKGNGLDVKYKKNWFRDYAEHPLIETVTELGTNRQISIEYSRGSKPSIQGVRVGRTRVGSYEYSQLGGKRVLSSFKTAGGQKTSYAYYTGSKDLGALSRLTNRLGGVTKISYKSHRFFFPKGNIEELVVDEIVKPNGGKWAYDYGQPSDRGILFLAIDGPNGWFEEHEFFTYARNSCSNDSVWKFGKPKWRKVGIGRDTKITEFHYAEPLTISEQPIEGYCSLNAMPRVARLARVVELYDGQRQQTVFSNFSYLSPQRVVRPGGIVDDVRFSNFVRENFYVLNVESSSQRTVNGVLTSRVVHDLGRGALPESVKIYSSDASFRQYRLDYFRDEGKAGALRSMRVGSYIERYDYANGVLNSIRYPDSSKRVRRTVNVFGRVLTEDVDGVQTKYRYDSDGRMTRLERDSTDSITMSYARDSHTWKQGGLSLRTNYDGSGQVISRTVWGDGRTDVYDFAYDVLGRVEESRGQDGINRKYEYDALGRVTAQRSVAGTVTKSYSEDGIRKTTETLENGIKFVAQRDYLGRVLMSRRGSESTNYSYRAHKDGIRQIVTSSGGTREFVSDFQGRLLREKHPELSNEIIRRFNEAGDLASVRNERPGTTLKYKYDDSRRLVEATSNPRGPIKRIRYDSTYGVPKSVEYGSTTLELSKIGDNRLPGEITLSFDGGARLPAPETYLSCAAVESTPGTEDRFVEIRPTLDGDRSTSRVAISGSNLFVGLSATATTQPSDFSVHKFDARADEFVEAGLAFQPGMGGVVDVDEEWAIVGYPDEPRDSVEGGGDSGKVRIFHADSESANGWKLHQELEFSVITKDEWQGGSNRFGFSVAIQGSVAVVGAPGIETDVDSANKATVSGASFVFRRGADDVWRQEGHLVGKYSDLGDQCGFSVATDGKLIVMGCPTARMSEGRNGGFYTFALSGGAWEHVGSTSRSSAGRATGALMGHAVALADGRLVVSRPNAWTSRARVFSFRWDEEKGQWTDETEVAPTGVTEHRRFGESVALSSSGRRLIVGAPSTDGTGQFGAASLYEVTSDGSWSPVRDFTGKPEAVGSSFGSSVDIDGPWVVIANPAVSEDSTSGSYVGVLNIGWEAGKR